MDTVTIIVLIACAAVIALALALLFTQRRHTRGLREGFGPEYDRTVRDTGATPKAERELDARRKRVEALGIRSLSTEQAERYSDQWRDV